MLNLKSQRKKRIANKIRNRVFAQQKFPSFQWIIARKKERLEREAEENGWRFELKLENERMQMESEFVIDETKSRGDDEAKSHQIENSETSPQDLPKEAPEAADFNFEDKSWIAVEENGVLQSTEKQKKNDLVN